MLLYIASIQQFFGFVATTYELPKACFLDEDTLVIITVHLLASWIFVWLYRLPSTKFGKSAENLRVKQLFHINE